MVDLSFGVTEIVVLIILLVIGFLTIRYIKNRKKRNYIPVQQPTQQSYVPVLQPQVIEDLRFSKPINVEDAVVRNILVEYRDNMNVTYMKKLKDLENEYNEKIKKIDIILGKKNKNN